MIAQNWTVCPIRSSGWAEKRTYKKPYEMEQTFEQMKDAAKEVHRRFYKYCDSSFNDIVNTDNVRDLRRVVIRYRDYVSDPRAAHYIRENYADVLEALGLRIQFYIDGRVRLYLVRTFGSRSELAAWDAENCDRCIKHDECELCDAIMAAYIGDGRVPLWVAKRIGCLYDPLYLSARLKSTCRERRTEEERDFPF